MVPETEIRPGRVSDAKSLAELISQVRREKWFLSSDDAVEAEQVKKFIERAVAHNLPQLVAIHRARIIGWCDAAPSPQPGYGHVGRLGLGVHSAYRGRGLGRALLGQCLAWAEAIALQKIELDVYADNLAAIRLYRDHGFIVEGIKRRARYFEGRYQDIQLMALFFNLPDHGEKV